MSVSFSQAAANRVESHLVSRTNVEGLRLGVKTSGCSGLSYTIDYADETSNEDLVFESHGMKIIVNEDDLEFLDGTIIDYVEDGLSAAFQFKNPNVTDACGCGESFTVKPSK
jgi:iron-sulfur cluster assembly protein